MVIMNLCIWLVNSFLMVSGQEVSPRQRGTYTDVMSRSSAYTGAPCTVPNCTTCAMFSDVSTVSGLRKYCRCSCSD